MLALTRSEFESAVKDALRHYTQPDLLAGNALLRASLLRQSGTGAATPQALRALLVDAANGLFAGERDRRVHRVLDLTYFNPAPKQEAAAERLGLSFSSYRRHLTAGVDRLIEWLWQQEQEAPQTEVPASNLAQATSPSTRPRLSIVILPFLNLSGDPSVDYIVDGIVDSLITDLSTHVLGSFVISRSTAFAYKGRSVGIPQVGSELSVRYVLEGSVSADASRIGVNVQLIDAETDEHLWAERFDKERRDIRQVQAEIVGRLSRSVGLEMVRAEAARRDPSTNSSDAEDLTMRGRALVHDVKQRENAEEAIDLFRRALEFDPDHVNAMAGIALARAYQVINLYRLEEREALLDEAEHMVSRGMALSPDHFALLKARGLLLRARGRFSEALVANEALIARNPVEPTAYKEIGLDRLYLGETQEAVEWFRRADAIAPRDPDRWTWLQGLGRALMQLGHDSEAVTVLSQAMGSNPGYVRGKAWLAAAEALAGYAGSARLHLAEYAALEPGMTVRRFAEERSSVPLDATSAVYRRECERILDGLRLAGMPDDVDGRPLLDLEAARPEALSGATELPQPVTELIGREADLSEVVELVKKHRLVTLTGEGGIGKTRLGVEVARHLMPEFADGTRVAELGPLSNPELIPIVVATALGLELRAGAMSAERVANALAGKQLMLVLDNCEHVIEAAAGIVGILLHANPSLRVLATSREALRTDGECLYRVPPLAVPAEGTEDRDELLRHGAVQLFLTRTRAADPHLWPDTRTTTLAATICRRLDGIPLAIELAAARGAALGIEEVASRLNDRFRLLTGGRRTELPRHQTLRATLDWSYELLAEPERVVLRRLAVFAGGFTLEAAIAVAAINGITSADVIDGVTNLIDKSLVTPEPGGSPMRYRLLETTRAYALEKLTEGAESDSLARRHAEYYRDLFGRAQVEWETQPAADWLAAYKPAVDNVRAALDWAFSPQGDTSIGVGLTVLSVPLWMHLSLLNECRGLVEQALSSLGSTTTRDTRHEMRLHVALGASLIYTKGPIPGTGAAWTSALQIAEKLDDTECQLQALRGLWAYHLNSAEYRASLRLAKRFCSVAAVGDHSAERLVGDRIVGTSWHYLGDQTNARHHIERMLAGYVAPAHRPHAIRFQFDQRVTARATLPRILWLQGFPDQAMRTAQGNVEDALAINHALSLCNALADAACPIALFTGDLEAAERFVTMLLDHTGKHAFAFWHALGHTFEAILGIKRGDVVTGLPLLRGALDELRQTGFLHCHAGLLGAFAETLGCAGQVDQGIAAIEEALAQSELTEGRWCMAELLRIKGELVLLEGAHNCEDAAQDLFLQDLDWARRQSALSWELRAATSLSRLWHDRGRTKEALELLLPVYNRFTEGFGTADLIAAKALLDALEPSPSPVPERGSDTGKKLNASPQPSEQPAMLTLPDKPSVAVLPFTNMSGDPEQEFLADGIAEDVITALSHYPSLFVIARNSCFTYKGRAVDVKQVGRELGVRYVLEGSLRKSGNRIRVSAQVVEAESGKHVWAERYDCDLADIFAVQDEITQAVTIAVAPAIADAELRRAMRKPPGSLDAWAAYQRGLWHLSEANPNDNATAQEFFQKGVELDPTFAGGYSGLALARLYGATIYQTIGLNEAQSSSEILARRAVALDGVDAEARSCLSCALRARGELEGALDEIERALAMSPNLAAAHGQRGATLIFSGRPTEGVAALDAYIRLDPRDPNWAIRMQQMAIGHYFRHDYEAAIEAAKRAVWAYPQFPNTYRWLAAALGQAGQIEEAKRSLQKAIAVAPTSFDMYVRGRVPWHRPEDHAHMLDGLCKAGWREK